MSFSSVEEGSSADQRRRVGARSTLWHDPGMSRAQPVGPDRARQCFFRMRLAR